MFATYQFNCALSYGLICSCFKSIMSKMTYYGRTAAVRAEAGPPSRNAGLGRRAAPKLTAQGNARPPWRRSPFQKVATTRKSMINQVTTHRTKTVLYVSRMRGAPLEMAAGAATVRHMANIYLAQGIRYRNCWRTLRRGPFRRAIAPVRTHPWWGKYGDDCFNSQCDAGNSGGR